MDTGFVIWYRSQKYNTPVTESLDNALKNYTDLLDKCCANHQVICISAPLPTIADDNDFGEVANQRKSIHATQRQRTDLTLEFNSRIRSFCRNKDANRPNLSFIDLDIDSLGPNGLVKPTLLNRNQLDHHYNNSEYAEILSKKLLKKLVLGSSKLCFISIKNIKTL